MKPLISVLVPTRQRVPQLARMLDSLYATAAEPNRVEVICRVDYDDYDTRQYLAFREVSFIVGPHLGYAKLAVAINEAARLSTSDLLIVVNDDVEFRTTSWEAILWANAMQYPDGIFDLGIETLNAGNFVFPCQSRKQVNILGCFYDERLIYPDIWLRDVLQPFGRAIRVPEVHIAHLWQGPTHEQQQAIPVAHSAEHQALYQQCVREGQAKIQTAIKVCIWCGQAHDPKHCLSDPAHLDTPTEFYLRQR